MNIKTRQKEYKYEYETTETNKGSASGQIIIPL